MKTLIINLPESTDRLSALTDRLKDHPYMETDVVEAVDGRRMSPEERDAAFDIPRFTALYRREPRPGEIGCTLSHQKAYRRVASEGENTLIIEDDIYPVRDFSSELEEIDSWLSVPRPRIAVVGCACMYCGQSPDSYDPADEIHKRLVKPSRYVHGTYAYALNPQAASLMTVRKPWFVADNFIALCHEHDIKIRVMLPSAIYPLDEEEAPTTITTQNNRPVKYSFTDRLHFLIEHVINESLLRTGILHKLESIPPRDL